MGPAGDHPHHLLDVVTGGVHDPEPGRVRRLGEVHDADDRRHAALFGCAQRLLLDGRQSTSLVSWRRLSAPNIDAEFADRGLEAGDDLDDAAGDRWGGGAGVPAKPSRPPPPPLRPRTTST